MSILQRTPACDQLDNQHYQGNDKQEVNEASQSVGADQTKQPEHQQNDENSPEHKDFLSVES
jgi:hypothetical protein